MKLPSKPLKKVKPGTLGHALTAARHGKGYTLAEASERSGVSPGYIGNLESGRMITAKEDTLEALAIAYEYPLDELLRLAGRVPKDVAKILRTHPDAFSHLRALCG